MLQSVYFCLSNVAFLDAGAQPHQQCVHTWESVFVTESVFSAEAAGVLCVQINTQMSNLSSETDGTPPLCQII